MRILIGFLVTAGLALAQYPIPGGSSGGGGGGASGAGVSYCAPASASGTAYTCAPSPALTAYASGTALSFVPDVNGSGGATTVNVNSLGAKSIKLADGTTNPTSSTLAAGTSYFLVYDGTAFRVNPVSNSPLECAVTVGATPALNATSCNGGATLPYNTFKLGPLAQATSPTTITNASPGQTYTIQVYQSASTTRTVTWDASFINPCVVDATLSSRTQMVVIADSTGSTFLTQNCTYADQTPTLFSGPTRTAPTTPTTGIMCWFDSTNLMEMCIDTHAQQFGMPLMTPYLSTGITLQPPMLNPLGNTLLNDTGIGTLTNGLVRLASGKAIKAAFADTGAIIGICQTNCTNIGTPTIVTHGNVLALFDATTAVVDDYVCRSTTVDYAVRTCGSSRPPLGQNLGRVLQGGAGNNAYEIWFEPDTAQLPNTIAVTAKTAAISTATLCASAAGACNQAGQYRIDWNFVENGTACADVTAGSVTFLLTWTDNSGAHSAVSLPMHNSRSLTATTGSFTFETTKTNAWAYGSSVIQSTGAIIQYATGYTACTSGTGTYELNVTVTRLQ